MKKISLIFFALATAASALCSQKNSGNPIFPGDFADPAIIHENGVFYIYITRQDSANVWHSEDFVNWKLRELNWPTSTRIPNMWAPGIAKAKDGKFYLYYTLRSQIYAGVSESPTGPFANLLPDEKPFILDKEYFPPKMHTIDADVFIDDDARAYLYWGSGWQFKDGVCAVAELNDDMRSFKSAPREITPTGYFEAPHTFKRNGKYYLMYSDGIFMHDTYKVRYAMSDSPMGPFVEGKNSPILVSDEKTKTHGPGHNFTIKIGEQMYIIYHKHEWPIYQQSRQVCIDKMEFDAQGNILPIAVTETGVSLDFVKKKNSRIILKPVKVFASSEKDGGAYKAENAFDENFGTIWMPDGKEDSWIVADFGKSVEIAAAEAFFAEIKDAYLYSMEYSDDAETWNFYCSLNNAEAKEWPILTQKKISARYMRLSVKGGKLHRYGIWEWKIYQSL